MCRCETVCDDSEGICVDVTHIKMLRSCECCNNGGYSEMANECCNNGGYSEIANATAELSLR